MFPIERRVQATVQQKIAQLDREIAELQPKPQTKVVAKLVQILGTPRKCRLCMENGDHHIQATYWQWRTNALGGIDQGSKRAVCDGHKKVA